VGIERLSYARSLIDLFDRALDHGIVVEAWRRASPEGIDLLTRRLRVIVVEDDD
jgi:hypothetical protein